MITSRQRCLGDQREASKSLYLLLPQNQFGYRDGGPNSSEGSAAGAQACLNQEASGGPGLPLEDQRCNGSLHKKSLSQAGVGAGAGAGVEDSGGQRYSADPTVFLGERASRGDTDEDGYMTPMKDKSSSGTEVKQISVKQPGAVFYPLAFSTVSRPKMLNENLKLLYFSQIKRQRLACYRVSPQREFKC